MKRIFTLMLAFIMIFAFVSCDFSRDDDDDDDEGGISSEKLATNAEDMGYIAKSDPTSPDVLAPVNAEFTDTIEQFKARLDGATDEKLIAAFGEDKLDMVKTLIDAEIKGEITYWGEFNNPTKNFYDLLICGFEYADDAEVAAVLFDLQSNGDKTVIVKDKYVVTGWSDEVVKAVINGATRVEEVNGMDAKELYQYEYERLSNATSAKSYTTQNIVVRLSELGAGYDETTSQEVTTVLVGDDQYGYVNSQENGNQEYWYVDGIYYLIVNGQKVKGELDLDAYAQKLGMQNAKQGLINVPADWFKGVELKRVSGEYFMVMTVKGEKYTEMIGNALGESYEAQGFGVKISDVAYKVYLDENGQIDYIVADYQLYLTIEGQTVTTDVYQRTEISDINSAAIPELYSPDSFTEVDIEGMLGLK